MELLRPRKLDRECRARQLPFSSPIDEAPPRSYVEVDFNGSFHKPAPYRLGPKEGVDQAWYILGVNTNHLLTPADRAKDFSLDPRRNAHLNSSNPYEGRGFTGHVAVMYQLHCLNLLRIASHYDYEYYWAKGQALADDDICKGGSDFIGPRDPDAS